MVYYDGHLLIELLPLSIASLCVSTRADEMKFTFSHAWILSFVILGTLFNVASLFFPWGILTSSSTYVYLLGGIVNEDGVPLPISDLSILMQAHAQLLTISNLIKVAIIVGWTGVVLYWCVNRCVLSRMLRLALSYGAILASSCLSFIAVAMFALTEIGLYWGAYLAWAGGVIMVLGIVMRKLKVEVVVEREVSEQGE